MTLQAPTPRLLLASASEARRSLLFSAGLQFEVRAAHVDEDEVKRSAHAEELNADDTAILLAEMKAHRIARGEPDALVIGCDQLLVCEDRWFDKPATIEQARLHLQALRGHSHVLITAVVCLRGEQRVWHHVARPRLAMRRFSDAFLAEYLAREGANVTHTVGAYRVEGVGMHLFDAIHGDHSTVLGLPLLPLLGFLRQHGVLME